MNDESDTGLGTTPEMWEAVSDATNLARLPKPVDDALLLLMEGEAMVVLKDKKE